MTVTKRVYFITVIDGVFCMRRYVLAINRRETRFMQFGVTLGWSEIMGGYNTPDIECSKRYGRPK